jgi:hypothetical protein
MIRKPGKTLSATRRGAAQSPVNRPEPPPSSADEVACSELDLRPYEEIQNSRENRRNIEELRV